MKRNLKTAIAAALGAATLGLSLWGLSAGQTTLKLVRQTGLNQTGSGLTFKLQLQSGSNSVVYVLQSSSNLVDWQTVLSGKSRPGTVLQVTDVSPTNRARFFRVQEYGPTLNDTNPPAWTNGLGSQFTVTPPGLVSVSWNAASDDVGVANYLLYFNGVLVTNLSAAILEYDFNVNLRRPADIRIQALDASGNASDVLSLLYMPGDLVLGVGEDGGRIYTLMVQTNGAFGPAQLLTRVNSGVRGLALGDFDRDGIMDLIGGGADGNTLKPYFFKGLGDGTFAPGVPLPPAQGANGYMMGATAGDFDGDGNLDFACDGNERYVFFYWGNGDGSFTVTQQDWGCCGRGLTAGDFNQDGRIDLARSTASENRVRVYLSDGDRTFTQATNIVAQNISDPYGLTSGDFDEDGHLDLIAIAGGSGDVWYFKGDGTGSFTNLAINGPWANLDVNNYASLNTFDYDSDGHLDIAMVTYSGQSVEFWSGLGDGTFSTNRIRLASNLGNVLGIGTPTRPPPMDVAIVPVDPITNLNGTIRFSAVGGSVTPADFFRWTFGDDNTNLVAWTFGEGTNNLGPVVSHTYTNEGRFLTRLWHTGTNGLQSVRGTWATIKAAPPVANPGGPYFLGEIAATQAVWYATLDASASTDDFGIVTYAWDFGDGSTATNSVPTVTHGWTNLGPWTVTLTVFDAARQSNSKSTTVAFTLGEPPIAVINGPDVVDETSARNGVWSTAFYSTNSTDDVRIWKYFWDFGNGQTSTSATGQTTYNGVGTYTVKLTVTDHANQTSTTTHQVLIKANDPPVPVITGPSLLTVDVATNGQWFGAWYATNSTDDTGIYQYTWAFGDGATASGTAVTHNYRATGVYPLRLTVVDNGNQSVSATQNVIVVAGNPPVARITASTLSPEGAQPVTLSGLSSTSDHGIYLYNWFLPSIRFDFAGAYLDPDLWQSAGATQNGRVSVTGTTNWGATYFFSIGSDLSRGGVFEGRVDTSSGYGRAMVGLKNLSGSGHYNQYAYAVYFNIGELRVYEGGGDRGKVGTYNMGTAYDVRIETQPGNGAHYFIRPSDSGQDWVKLFDSTSISDTLFSYGADVYDGVFGFEHFQLSGLVSFYPSFTTPLAPGGTVTLQVVDAGLQTNSTSVVITPIVGTPPIAVISGPTNGQTSVELAFNAYGSSDDHGIASYSWDFGDNTPLSFGPAVTHHYTTPGTYTNTVTVVDYAGQSSSASLVTTVTEGNYLVCVPWLIINGLVQPHEVYSGKTNTLKAVASAAVPVPFTNIWDFGDASGSVTNVVTNVAGIYNLEAVHAYTGTPGTPFYATATVITTNGTVYRDTYLLVIRPKTIDIEMKVAIDEGLWYMHKTQNRYNFDPINKGGDWTANGAKISPTASAVQAFAINGHLVTDDGSRDPYVETVQRAVNYLFSAMTTVAIGPQTYGDPDGNHNGIALCGNTSYPIYETGPVMDALIAVGRPELIAPVGPANVRGRTYRDIMQDLVDAFCWGQFDDATVGGGWRYGWNQGPDNSASQWGAIGMYPAEQFWGIQIPDWVKERNKVWLNYSYDNLGFGYTGPGGVGMGPNGDDASTPSALVQAAFDGLTITNNIWIHGENYLANYWATLMGNNNVYANYSIAKAMRTALPQPVHNFALNGKDWFLDPVDGLARVTVDHQNRDGSWNSARWVDPPLATPWSIIILSSSLFQQGPVAVISVAPNPSAMGYPVVFDGRGSYHKHPGYLITEYRWIFDSSKGLDFEHPDAIGPVVTNVYGSLSTNTVSLQVRDNGSPQLFDVASVVVSTTVPPYPPTADAGGPYVACVGQDVHLDASGSFCVDAAAGNFIQSYDWEMDFQVPLDFNDGVTGVKPVLTNGFSVSGAHQIGLRVKNANSLVYTNFALPDQTADAFTTIYVYDRVIDDLRVRPKGNKAQLTWTKVGDYGVVVRSSEGPDRGFTKIGQTDSAYATFLDTDVAYNTEYYYRVYAYVNGRPDPLGVSDPIFMVSPPRSFDEHAPAFQSTPVRLAQVGQLYDVTLDAKDPENKPLFYSLLQGPTNMTVNATSGEVRFTPTPDQIGTHLLSFQVTNDIGRDVLSYNLFVMPASNNVPVAVVNGPYSALTGQPIQFSSAGTSDLDGNPLRYFWNFGDGSTDTNANPAHVYGGIGDYLVTLYVNDGYGGTASAVTTARITRPNRPPTAVVANGPQFAARLGETLTLNGSGSYDLDGDPLTFTWIWGDGGTNSGSASTSAHLYAAASTYDGQLVVADNRGGSSAYPFNVVVGPSNQPPSIVLNLSTDQPFAQTVLTADATGTTDPEGDPLAFEWDFGDRTRTTGSLVTHAYKQIGDVTLTLKVSDNHGGVSSVTRTVHVLNAPPVFTSNPPLLARANTNYTYTPTLTDVDGDTSTFALVQGPATMSCDTNTGALLWLPGTNDVGSHAIVLRATDANGAGADQSFTVVVTTPLGPQLDLAPTHIEMTNVVVDSQTLALSGTVRVYLRNNGSDAVPVPFTISVFVDADFDNAFSTNTDRLVSYGNFPAGLPAGTGAWMDLGVQGKALFKDSPLSAFVDSQGVVPEYDELNNIRRAGFDADTNQPPVIDLSAAYLQVDRTALPASAGLTARLGNSGYLTVPTNVPMAFYDGDPKAGGTLIGVASSTIELAPGRFQDLSVTWASPAIAKHTVYVVADDPGTGVPQFSEINPSNNVMSLEVDLASVLPPVASAGPDQSVYLGDTVVLNGQRSTDPQGKPLTYRWSFLSIPISSRTQLAAADTVAPSFVADVAGPYTLQLVVNNGILDSTNGSTVKITAVDTNVFYPPSITSTPSFQAMVGTPYQYQVVATDPQNQPLHFRLPQGPVGMLINTNTGLVLWTPTNTGNPLVQVAADGVGGSAYQTYSLNVIVYTNYPPQFTSTPVTTALPGVAYTYTAVAVDQNGDTVTYSLSQKPTGMNINAQTGAITWTPAAGQLGGNAVTIVANDNHGATATQSFNLVVLNAVADGPIVQPIPDQTVVEPGTFATIPLDNYVADANYPDSQITWTFTGTNKLSINIDPNRVATITYPPGTLTSERITFLATDPDGKSAYAAPLLTVRGADNPPVAAIANLSDTDTTSINAGFFELRGTADDPDAIDPVAYQVLLYDTTGTRIADLTPKPVNAAGAHEGRVPAGGSLGTLDFTTVRNGAYTLVLQVQGGAQVVMATAPISLDSTLKIGQVRFAQEDLVLPVRGAGLQVVRTYDSFDQRLEDFGYSWTFSVTDLGVSINEDRVVTQDVFEEEFSIRTGGGRDVTLDMPDTGRRVTFRYSLEDAGLAKLRATWTPPPGVHATLVPTVSPIMISLWNLTYWQAAPLETSLDNFDFPGFVLTLQDGTQYRIDRQDLGTHYLDTGSAIGSYVEAWGQPFLSRITDSAGNHTDFVRQSGSLKNIVSYNSANEKVRSILFQRDTQNRISAIYAPENVDTNGTPTGPASVTYQYDPAGNLTNVSKLSVSSVPGNPVYTATTYRYTHPRFPHLLTEVVDFRGISVMRAEFDEDGRLIGTIDAEGNRTSITRDIAARTETIFDRLGNATQLAYDAHGYLSASTDPLGHTTLYTHDENGRTTSQTDPLGNTTRSEYNTDGNLTAIVDPLGNRTTFTYGTEHQVLSMTDPLGHVTTNSYNAAGQVASTANALGQTIAFQYDPQGNPITSLDIRGNPGLQYQYDSSGRPSQTVSPGGVTMTYSYDDAQHLARSQVQWVNPDDTNDVRLLTSQMFANEQGRPTRTVTPTGLTNLVQYDDFAQPVRFTDPQGNVSTRTYDIQGRVIEVQNADGTRIRTVYDAMGRKIVETERQSADQPVNGTVTIYDAAGRAVASQLLSNVVVQLDVRTNANVPIWTSRFASAGGLISAVTNSYDAAGRLIARADAYGAATRYEYDAGGHKTAEIDPLGGRIEYEYDGVGHVTLMRDALGREIWFLYDPVGRLVRTVYPDGGSFRTVYDDAANRRSKIDELGQTRDLQYDSANHLTSVDLPAVPDPENGNTVARPRFGYTYDQYGNLHTIRDAKGRETRFAYDEFNRLVSRTLPGGQTSHQSFETYGQLHRSTDFNGQATEFAYDQLGHITRKSFYAAGSNDPSAVVTIDYDTLGRQNRFVDARGNTTFDYDGQGRLVRIAAPEGALHYAYDPVTGAKVRTWTDNSDTLYGYDALNRLSTVTVVKRNGQLLAQPEVTAYSYDAAGNRQSVTLPNGVTSRYQYDQRYRLVRLTQTDSSSNLLASYAYTLNAKGQRLTATEVKLVPGGSALATNFFAYTYDALGRLVAETNRFAQTNFVSFASAYTYDLVGNRLQRQVTTGGKTLTTTYLYDVNDRLVLESNIVVAAASSGAGNAAFGIPLRVQRADGSVAVRYRPLPSAWCYYAIKSIPYGLGAAFVLPALLALWRRRRRLQVWTTNLRPDCALLPRCLSGFLAGVMLLISFDTRAVADEAALYAALSTDTWGLSGSVTSYEYDANGSVTLKVTTGPNPETVVYTYTLDNRLESVITTSDLSGQEKVVLTRYTYDPLGNRVRSESRTALGGVPGTPVTNIFLVDPYNLTGVAQVLEDLPAVGAAPNVSYTIGDDVLAQTTGSGPSTRTEYLLYDGHGSTRQLVDPAGAVVDSYAYDAFGILLGDRLAADSARTRLLYAGEYFDSSTQQYHLRARDYDQRTGRFSSLDPLLGSTDDPPSLHKYLYSLNDPVNRVDPAGTQSLGDVMCTVAILSILVTLACSLGNGIAGNGFTPDAAIWGVSLTLGMSGVGLLTTGGSIAYLTAPGLLSLLMGESGTDLSNQVLETLGVSGGTFLLSEIRDLIAAGASGTGSVLQATYSVGAEFMSCARDHTLSLWGYHGPGLNAGASTQTAVSVAATFYAGTVWHVKDWSSYAGPFIGFSFSFAEGIIGFTASWFYSQSNLKQNGVFTGVTFTEGASASAGAGLAYYNNLVPGTRTVAGIDADYAIAFALPPPYNIFLMLKARGIISAPANGDD